MSREPWAADAARPPIGGTMRPLTYILLFVFLTCIFTLVGAATQQGNTITLSAAESADCEKEGGCTVVTSAFLLRMIEQIHYLNSKIGKSCA